MTQAPLFSPASRYLSTEYVEHNPTWDSEDSPWKAGLITELLRSSGLRPDSIAEVGCGAGGVLAALRSSYPEAFLAGYDIAPAASRFWPQHEAAGIDFRVGDFLALNDRRYDVALLLDVVEHLADPFTFLAELRAHADYVVFIVPLDLSAISVLREKPILNQRSTVGHIHYFTKNLALALLEESGYQVLEWRYSGATFQAPQRTWKTRLASVPRRLAYALDKDLGVRALGGETLVALARCER